jgi:MoaA/NifB/PqqE/SkfB family radical SAM enzyme
LFKTLTPRKIRNALRVHRSYKRSLSSGVSVHSGAPISIAFEPTTSCNLRCPECPSGLRSFTRNTGMLEEQFFKKTIDDLAGELIYLTFYFQGEPYLNSSFLKMASYAAKKKIYTSTSTNAHFITEESAKETVTSGLHRLIISIDGASQETYEQYRVGGQLAKVIEGTKKIVAWKKKLKSSTPYLIFQFLVVRPNEHELQTLV